MRLLSVGSMYPPHHQGGYELVWRSFVEHARAAGHDVRVLAGGHREPGVAEDDPPHVRRALPSWWADHAFPPRTRRERIAIARRAAAVLREELPGTDAVVWFAMGGLPLGLLALAGPLPAVGVAHDAWPAYGPRVDGWVDTRLGRTLARPLGLPAHVAWPTRWSVNSAFVRDALRLPGEVRVHHPGVDPRRFGPAPPPARFGSRLAYVGRLDPRKGLEHAVAALPQLPGASLTVHGTGDPAHAAALQARAQALGVADRLRLAGPTRDPRAALAAADALVFPVTWEEPFGLAPLEAMAVGRPVVATATGGAREYLDDGRNALVVPPGDAAAIAAAVRRLADDPGVRDRLRAGGHATAMAFTQTRCDQGILDLVLEAARSGGGQTTS